MIKLLAEDLQLCEADIVPTFNSGPSPGMNPGSCLQNVGFHFSLMCDMQNLISRQKSF